MTGKLIVTKLSDMVSATIFDVAKSYSNTLQKTGIHI
jgi:hypothetical protein